MTRLRNGRGPKSVAKSEPAVLSRKAKWVRRLKRLGIGGGIGAGVLVVGGVALTYWTQADMLNTIESEYKSVETAADATRTEFEAASTSERGQAVLALPLFDSAAWSGFASQVAESDADELEGLQDDFRQWGAAYLWYPDLQARHERFVSGLTLSVTAAERAEYSTLYAMDVICADAAATVPDDGVAESLALLFQLDEAGSVLSELQAASPSVCGLPV